MQNAAGQRSIRIALFSLLMSAAFGVNAGIAQSGSAGGSIGNDEKSLSGSRATPRAIETEKPTRRSKPEAESPRRASRSGGGGGGGNFDGAWMVTSVGCGGTTTGAVVVTSGRIIAQGVSGSVSGNGSARTVGNFNGITVTSSGRLSGRSGSGTFRQSTGCGGTWTASKQ
ncbi:hypothetical protein [Bradyrhizobium sp. AUGA SZCCT0431]|uniref:hypothetical protein n=1 Tax=Bradyrhizobium sp. AUGA SZCCT0431 TaxID=2807674 RepID=UPI001BABBCC7|nr:hypothetical protein [Bradyrhizobium sp. AUGA SZCCT0431]MBR1147402.1 hypothetical protein [Bradyrhizobium sp. AUGA SZCCT0431]